jgi:hypothetical protein
MAHATVAGLLASAFVGIAKDMLSSAIAGQATLLCNFGVDLEDMEDMLEDISAVLEDAVNQGETGAAMAEATQECLHRHL